MLRESGVERPRLQQAWPRYDAMRTELAVGQFADIATDVRDLPSMAAVLEVARRKSGNYTVRRPLEIGAAMADRRMLPRVNAIRTELGAQAVGSVDELMRRAPLLLAVGGEPFEYPHPDWGDTVHLIGACTPRPQDASALDSDWLASIEQPIVLVSTSSVRQADTVLGVTALQALAGEPVHVIATFPAGVPAGVPMPPNATVRQFVSHDAVLEHSVCAVTHGGMGTTVRALDRGVPVCVVPFARDQAEVARRVEVARCGTRLVAKRLTAAGLHAKVREAMTLTDGAARVAAGFAATGGTARGAQLIEQRLLARHGVEWRLS